ncbi:MAG: 1,6-anhydro-N-acetylmuramyl-L-alanine amidase AmpD [Casimicrobium sp.]
MIKTQGEFVDGWLIGARRVDSPNFDQRPDGAAIDVVVLHHISLPAGQFGGDAVERLFTNRIDANEPELGELANTRVSAHFFLRRDGEIVQFVRVQDRAWHAGVSVWRGRERCNDFSIGIEIEGDNETAFAESQYEVLNILLENLRRTFGVHTLTTHSEIAFGRKVDPGNKFDLSLIKLGDKP